MRILLALLALYTAFLAPSALSANPTAATFPNSTTMVSSDPGNDLIVHMIYSTLPSGKQVGGISFQYPGSPVGPESEFTYLSNDGLGLEAYWNPPTPGNTITFSPSGEATGFVTLPGGERVNLKEK